MSYQTPPPIKPDPDSDSDSDNCDVVIEKAPNSKPDAKIWNITFLPRKPSSSKPIIKPDMEDSDDDDGDDDGDDDDVVIKEAPESKPNAKVWDITFLPKIKSVAVAATSVTKVSMFPIKHVCSHINSWNQLVASTGNGVSVDDRFEAFQFGNETSALEPGVWHPNQRATMVSVKSLMNDA